MPELSAVFPLAAKYAEAVHAALAAMPVLYPFLLEIASLCALAPLTAQVVRWRENRRWLGSRRLIAGRVREEVIQIGQLVFEVDVSLYHIARLAGTDELDRDDRKERDRNIQDIEIATAGGIAAVDRIERLFVEEGFVMSPEMIEAFGELRMLLRRIRDALVSVQSVTQAFKGDALPIDASYVRGALRWMQKEPIVDIQIESAKDLELIRPLRAQLIRFCKIAGYKKAGEGLNPTGCDGDEAYQALSHVIDCVAQRDNETARAESAKKQLEPVYIPNYDALRVKHHGKPMFDGL